MNLACTLVAETTQDQIVPRRYAEPAAGGAAATCTCHIGTATRRVMAWAGPPEVSLALPAEPRIEEMDS
jgi:hypothetical protein